MRQSSAKRWVVVPGDTTLGRSLMKSRKSSGPRTIPWGTPAKHQQYLQFDLLPASGISNDAVCNSCILLVVHSSTISHEMLTWEFHPCEDGEVSLFHWWVAATCGIVNRAARYWRHPFSKTSWPTPETIGNYSFIASGKSTPFNTSLSAWRFTAPPIASGAPFPWPASKKFQYPVWKPHSCKMVVNK